MLTAGAVVLAGGRSSRMGTPKASLPWHGSTLLRHVVGLASRGVDGPVVVVRAPGQPLPELPASVEVVDDPVEGAGPLQGIACGLGALAGRTTSAFVCSNDLPHLHLAYVRALVRAGADADVAVAVVRGHRQPLAACYATALADRARALLAEGRARPAFLLEDARVAVLDEAALLADPAVAAGDPELLSVEGVNTPDEHAAALARPLPQVVVQRFGVLATGGEHGERRVSAANLGAAAAAVGLVLDRHVMAALNGDQVVRDPLLPLVTGDVVALLSADAGG